MRSLAEKIIRDPWESNSPLVYENAKAIIGPADGAGIIFRVGNVGEYYAQNQKDTWSFEEDFLNLAPPFKNILLTYESKHLFQGEDGEVALFVTTRDCKDECDDGARWELEILAFTDAGGEVNLLPFIGRMRLDGQGRSLKYKSGYRAKVRADLDALEAFGYTGDVDGLLALYNIPLLALTFMNCRNIDMVEHDIAPKLKAKRARRGKPEFLKYYTLEITALKKMLDTKGQASKHGLKTALHLCRGHFKDYRESGLYGKHKGVYWWGDQVRGSNRSGVVIKDYSIHANH